MNHNRIDHEWRVSSRRWPGVVLLTLLAAWTGLSSASPVLHAQQDAPRKSKKVVPPLYPPLARQLRIQGTVRVTVVVAPDGKVKTAHALGGHPLLIPPAEEAAKRWEFEPANKETSQVLDIEFTLNDN
jgi:TonB family protein